MMRRFYINGNTLVQSKYLLEFSLQHTRLRVSMPEITEFPDVIEIKITNKCIHECYACKVGSNELGINKINTDLLINNLDMLPKLPLTFIISGGNILENLNDLHIILKYLRNNFNNCSIIVNINAFDLARIGELPKSFGKVFTNSFLELPNYYSISMSQAVDLIKDGKISYNIFKHSNKFSKGLQCISFGCSNIIWRFDHSVFPFYSIDIYDMIKELGNNYIIEGSKFQNNNNKKIIRDFIIDQKKYIKRVSITFDYLAYNQLELNDILDSEEREMYMLGWNNYVYIDAVEGSFGQSKFSDRKSWSEVNLLDFYNDTYNKQGVLSKE